MVGRAAPFLATCTSLALATPDASYTDTGLNASVNDICEGAVAEFGIALDAGACDNHVTECSEACFPAFRSLLDACIRENFTVTNLTGSPQPFDTIHTAGVAVGYLSVGSLSVEGSCADAAVNAALGPPELQATCGHAAFFLGLFYPICNRPNGTTCPQACQSILELPFRACEPSEEVTSGSFTGSFDELVNETRFRLVEPECLGVLNAQQHLVGSEDSTTEPADTTDEMGAAMVTGTEDESTSFSTSRPAVGTTAEVGGATAGTTTAASSTLADDEDQLLSFATSRPAGVELLVFLYLLQLPP